MVVRQKLDIEAASEGTTILTLSDFQRDRYYQPSPLHKFTYDDMRASTLESLNSEEMCSLNI